MTHVNTHATAAAFADKMLEILNSGALALMISVGHRTGLFDTMATLPPSTSARIAYAAGLHERYVREWLGAMAVGRIVAYDAATGTYHLPPEHAASRTRAAAPNNLAMFMQYVPQLGAVEDGIADCFRHGGGVPYAAFPRFQKVMAEESRQTVAAALLDAILPLVPGVVEALYQGIAVLDVDCGSGHALNLMARTFPRSRFTGSDLSPEGIATGTAEAQAWGLSNSQFAVKDVATIEDVDRYGLVTAFDAIHDQARPRQVLQRIARALQPEGTLLMQDIAASSAVHNNYDLPMAPLLYTVSCMHCMTVSLAQHGEGLGAMWGEEKARELLAEAGFTHVEVARLPHDFQNSYYIVTRRVAS